MCLDCFSIFFCWDFRLSQKTFWSFWSLFNLSSCTHTHYVWYDFRSILVFQFSKATKEKRFTPLKCDWATPIEYIAQCIIEMGKRTFKHNSTLQLLHMWALSRTKQLSYVFAFVMQQRQCWFLCYPPMYFGNFIHLMGWLLFIFMIQINCMIPKCMETVFYLHTLRH